MKLTVWIFAIIILCLSCTYETSYNYPVPPDLHSECDDVGEMRRYTYGDYEICVECILDETAQYGYYKYWDECEKE